MHIAYVIQQFPPEVGAGPARAAEMAKVWIARGAQVSIVTAFPTRRLPGVVAPNLDPRYRRRFSVQEEWELMNVVRSWVYPSREGGSARTIVNNLSFAATSLAAGYTKLTKPDVIIASSPPFFAHLGGYALARLTGAPLVLELRDLWPDYLVGLGKLRRSSAAARMLFALESRLLISAQHIVTVTDAFARRVGEKGVAPDRITTVTNGVNTDLYFPLNGNGASADRPFTVGYLGTFGIGQGLEFVIEAAVILAREKVPVRFILVGDGPQRRRIGELVNEKALTNVTLQPPIEKAATPGFYQDCDVCLVPHAPVKDFGDTIPSKVFEILACGKPVIASVIGETKRLIEESSGGVVADPGDPRALVEAIKQLFQLSEAERRAMGLRGHRYVSDRYNRVEQADRFLQLLKDVAARNGGAGITQHAR
jgi:glycosyltransferase involved in cell wall biosynthesis